ncbi:MAG TPA: O-antigen ligase family protein, partial [Solirubrobacterales bacterium]|nr:O-antigen ligase family protein [Solirubrobacterales bacterium]
FFSPTRLAFPINYWNGTATLIALGAPLVLFTATSARNPLAAGLAAAALPLMALAAYFTYSRGAMIAGLVGLAIFIGFSYDRIPRLVTLLGTALGTALLISAAAARPELADGLLETRAAQDQGGEILLLTVVVCLVVGAAQAAFTLALGKGARPTWVPVPHRPARIASLTLAVVAFLAALAFNVPGQISDGWDEFVASEGSGAGAERLSSFSGSGRYQLWEVAAEQYGSAPVLGTGAGTYEFWHNRLGDGGFVRDAHSLFMETLGELGLIGLALLVGLVLVVLIGGGMATARAPGRQRSQLAALLATCVAFVLSAAPDWTWELAVLPAIFLVCAAPLITAGGRGGGGRRRSAGWWGGSRPLPWQARAAVVPVAVAATVALAIPLVSESLLQDSREAAAAGDLEGALADARDAEAIQPAAASPRLQQALIFEAAGELAAAEEAAAAAVRREETNWRPWLTLARVQAKRGRAPEAVRSYERARTLNARSVIFPAD